MTTAIAIPDQFKDAIALVERVKAIKVIKTKAEYDAANTDYKTLITNEKKLKIQFDELDVVKTYEKAYAQYATLKADFATAKKYIKDGPMLDYDNEEKRILLAEQNRLAEIARKEKEAETARLVAEQKRVFDLAQAEAKRLEKIAAEKAAAQKKIDDAEYARLKKEGDKKAAEAAKKAAIVAAHDAKVLAETEAENSRLRAEDARTKAEIIKADAAMTPAPVVILEPTHQGVSRRKVYKYRLTAKDGRKFLKGEITAAVRLTMTDIPSLPPHLFVLSPVFLNDYVDGQGEMAAIPGVLEVKSEMV